MVVPHFIDSGMWLTDLEVQVVLCKQVEEGLEELHCLVNDNVPPVPGLQETNLCAALKHHRQGVVQGLHVCREKVQYSHDTALHIDYL